jgi:hypothetical protein
MDVFEDVERAEPLVYVVKLDHGCVIFAERQDCKLPGRILYQRGQFATGNRRKRSTKIPPGAVAGPWSGDLSTRDPALGRGLLLRIPPHGRSGRCHGLARGAPHLHSPVMEFGLR